MALIKGINGWTFSPETPLPEAAHAARAAGFEAFEPTIGHEGQITPTTDEATCREIGEAIRESGLTVASLASGIYWQTSLTSPDASVREQAHEVTIASLERANWLGAPALLVVPGVVARFDEPDRPLISYSEALRLAFDALRQLAYEAERFGVVIAIENVWNQFLLSPVEMRDLLDRVNSPWVGAYFDVGNVLKFGFPQHWIDTLGKRIVRIHLKDFQLAVGTVEGFCPLGDGDVDWAATVGALKRNSYDGPVTYEGPGDLSDISARIDRILAGQ